jgi:acetolactate synthase-1/2/3 large subunit
MATKKLNGGHVVIDYLLQQKAPSAFGLCGHGNIQFIDALHERQSHIKTISVHHESVAGFMADVYYRVSAPACGNCPAWVRANRRSARAIFRRE